MLVTNIPPGLSIAAGERVRDGVAQRTRLGVNSTPTVYINGRMLSGAQPYETFASVIDEECHEANKRGVTATLIDTSLPYDTCIT